MIVIVTGAPGTGKTKTVAKLMESTLNSAAIDGDPLLGINPFNRTLEERQLQFKNIASVAKNYHEAGFKTIFISFVYGQKQLDYQSDLLKDIDELQVFVLITNEATLRKRHLSDAYKREDIESSLELNEKMSQLKDTEVIDNSNLTLDQVVAKIKEHLNLN